MLQEIKALLSPAHPWGQQLVYLDVTDSTNNAAKALARQGAPHGTVVIAGQQTLGRGRMGRSFSSPAGLGLYYSVILRPACPAEALLHLTCAVGLAASDAVAHCTCCTPQLKWANDLIVDGKKLGGILTELSVDARTKKVDYAVIGIGINCLQREQDFPPELRETATSLLLCGAAARPATLAAALTETLRAMSQQLLSEQDALMRDYALRCITVGKEIGVLRAGEVRHARALGVDRDGSLRVRYADGMCECVRSGEVSVRGLYGYL